MLWSSYTRTLLRCSRCFSILPSRLSGNPMALSLVTHCFLSAHNSAFDLCQTLFEFLGKTIVQPHCDLLRRPQVYRSLTLPALASLLGLNPSRLWLLPSSMI